MHRLLVLTTIALATLTLQGCLFGCGDEVTQRAVSPDGRWLAAAFVRNCGATTDFVTHVVIVEAGDPIDDDGDVFVAEAGAAASAPQGGPEVRLRWLGPDRLLVSYGPGARIFFQAVRKRKLHVEYRPIGEAPAG